MLFAQGIEEHLDEGMAQLRVALAHRIVADKYHVIGSSGNGAAQKLVGHLLDGGAGAVHGHGKAALLLGGLGGKALAFGQAGEVLHGNGVIHGDGKRFAAGVHFLFCHHYGHGAGLAFGVDMVHNNTS